MDGLKINSELVTKIIDETILRGNPNTMARRKLKRKIRLYNIETKEVYGPTLNFDDLTVGDIFCMYEYNGDPVLCDNKHNVMVVREIKIKERDRSNIVLKVDPYII